MAGMTCTQAEAKTWIRQNWEYLCRNGQLAETLKRYTETYIRHTPNEYERIKTELDKISIDK